MNTKQYKKMCRKHKKILKRITKNAVPWDSGSCLEYLIAFITFMRDYYQLDENVYGKENTLDESNDLTRIESLNKALTEYKLYVDTEDKYFLFKGEKFTTLIPNKKENMEMCLREKEKHLNQFWNILKEYFNRWWD